MKVMGQNDGGAGSPALSGFPEHLVDRANERQYEAQQHPVASVGAYSMASVHSHDWHTSDPGAPFQHYDPTYEGHQGTASVTGTSTTLAPTIPTQIAVANNTPSSHVNTAPGPVPDPAAMQEVTTSDYRGLQAGPASNSPNTAQQHRPSVNYGPRGRLDAGTGADFSLLPDYQSPINGIPINHSQHDDTYEATTPSTPPPPHSAHTRTARPSMPGVAGSSVAAPTVAPSELPTEQTYRGYGPDAELPGDLQQPMLRHQRSNVLDAEQKFLVAHVMPFRNKGRPAMDT